MTATLTYDMGKHIPAPCQLGKGRFSLVREEGKKNQTAREVEKVELAKLSITLQSQVDASDNSYHHFKGESIVCHTIR